MALKKPQTISKTNQWKVGVTGGPNYQRVQVLRSSQTHLSLAIENGSSPIQFVAGIEELQLVYLVVAPTLSDRKYLQLSESVRTTH